MTQSRKKVVAEAGGKGAAVTSGGGLTSAVTVAPSVEVMVRGDGGDSLTAAVEEVEWVASAPLQASDWWGRRGGVDRGTVEPKERTKGAEAW
jgi:hypothetical protein